MPFGTIALNSTRPAVVTTQRLRPSSSIEEANGRLALHVAVRERHLDLGDRDEPLQRRGGLLVALVLREVRRRLGREVAAEHDVLARLGDRDDRPTA